MRLVLGLISLVALLFVGLLVGPSFINWNSYKPQIISQIKAASGYDVEIAGDLKLAILPTPNVTIEQVSVQAPRKIESETLITAQRAHVSLALAPLLQKQVQVNAIELVKPVVTLEVLKDGSPAWMSETLQKAQDVTEALPEQATQEASAAGSSVGENISFDSISIQDGQVTYIDHAKGTRQSVQDIDLQLSAPTLKGPFQGRGAFVYEGRPIELRAKTGRFEQGADNISVTADITLPQDKASLSFSGIAAMAGGFEVQGETDFKADNLAALAPASGLSQSAAFKGIVTASEEAFLLSDAQISLGDVSGSGKIAVEGLKARAPLRFDGEIKLDGVLDLESLQQNFATRTNDAPEERLSREQPAPKADGFLPQTVTVPGAMEGRFTLEAGGVKFGGQSFNGIMVNLSKQGDDITVTSKVMELPGQGKAETTAKLSFASKTVSEKDGTVTFSDPTLAFETDMQADQLPDLIMALAPNQKDNAAIKAFKTARIAANGVITPQKITLNRSTAKLDRLTAGLSASFAPAKTPGGKPNVVIDISADTLDFDAVQSRMGTQQKTSANTQVPPTGAVQSASSQEQSLEEMLAPVRDFALPVNVTFDLSLQTLWMNAQDISGIRLIGKTGGAGITFETASANNVMGGSVSAKGAIKNLKALSGVDLDLYGKTQDADALMTAFKVDTSSLPTKIGAAQATINLKGAAEEMGFSANISALRGRLDATGTLKDLLSGKPNYTDLALGIEHPNLVQAVQIFNPAFKGPVGLAKPVDFYAAMSGEGQTYNLSGIRAKIGPTTIGGTLKADMSGTRPALSGEIDLGALALDVLLTGEKAAGSSSRIARTSASSGSSQNNGARWSRNAIETGWMRSADLDFNVSADRISYGAWVFENPKTDFSMKDGAINISDLSGGIFGGTATLNTDVTAPADPKQPLSINAAADMSNVSIEQLASALSGSGKLKGRGTVNFDMDVQSTGISPSALVNTLKGKANLNGEQIVLEGFDFARLARGLAVEDKLIDSAASFVRGATSGGETRFDTLNGVYNITEGVARIQTMKLGGPDAVVNSTGQVSLPAYTIDTQHQISLKNVEGLEPFNVTIKGPLDNPSTLGFNVVEEYLGKKLQRKIVKELPKLLGDDVNEKLQQFGIIPREQAPAAGTETQGETETPQNVAPAQQQQQPTPEEAIRGVLDGLLR